MIAQFTPAPWSIRATCSGHSIYGPTGKRVCYTYVTSYPGAREQAEADAKLIARAPELQEENEALVHDLERVMMRENCYLNALMLISGMRGKAAEVANRALYSEHHDPALASADTLPQGQDAKQGLAGTESGAVPEGQTPSPSPSPAAGR